MVEISQVLDGALRKLGVKGEWDTSRVEVTCREWLGDEASKALSRVEERRGTVTLYFNHSAWLNEMNYRRKEGLDFLKSRFPQMDLKEVRCVLSKDVRGGIKDS